AGEKTPTRDSASASAASKSSIPCKVAESENTASITGDRNRESSRFMRRVYALLQSNKRIHDITYRFEEKRVAKTGLTVQIWSARRNRSKPWGFVLCFDRHTRLSLRLAKVLRSQLRVCPSSVPG